jgi:hypothetical protein
MRPGPDGHLLRGIAYALLASIAAAVIVVVIFMLASYFGII